MSSRDVVFISHANPEDNAFTIWLGAKLAIAGFEVWADVLRLRGGFDWQRKLEDAIRGRVCKVLLVANEYSVRKQGVRNEIQIASDVARRIKDEAFIIPLRLGPFESPFLIAQAQYINFEKSWAAGLKELLEALNDTYKVAKMGGNTEVWRDLQLMHGRELTAGPEHVVSSWLEARRLPTHLFFQPPGTPVNNYPAVQYGDGVLTFAGSESRREFCRRTSDLLRSGWPSLGMTVDDARRRFTDLINQGVGSLLRTKNLNSHEMANRQLAWWVPATGPTTGVTFQWPHFSGRRQIQGLSTKRNIRWHFGISTSFRAVPFNHVRLKSRLIFTQDGQTPIESAARAHRLRRSFARGWRNARWRDMLLAFLFWVADGTTVLVVPVAPEDSLVLSLPTMSFSCPVGVQELDDGLLPDEDDPDVEFLNYEDFESDDADQT